MKIQMIGHASIFVETQDSKILMDPVLFSSVNQGIETICPEREVIHELIPEFDLLILSHWHADHYDPRSLASLPKNVDVLIPRDKILKKCLQKLGYSRIYTLSDFDEVKIGSTSILATRSEHRVPEYGIVFSDPSGVFWNQVDSAINAETVNIVKTRYPQIDFLLAGWQPMLEVSYQYNDNISFPYTAYSNFLADINMIKPVAMAPGSNGFKKVGSSSWMNQTVFPVTKEQFCKDLQTSYSEIGNNLFVLEPGDIMQFEGNIFNCEKGKSRFVSKTRDDRDDIDFSPINLDSKIIDDNSECYDINVIKKEIEVDFLIDFAKFIVKNRDLLFSEHTHWKVIYQLEVVFPNHSMRCSLDFSDKNAKFNLGRNPCANLFTVITASSLYSLIKKTKGWQYIAMGGYHRTFQKIYMATPHGIVKPVNSKMEDPISLLFPNKDIFEDVQYQEAEKWFLNNGRINSSNKNANDTFMMRLGKTLVRVKKLGEDENVVFSEKDEKILLPI
jgi:UDP-MurNAc hydroxylase